MSDTRTTDFSKRVLHSHGNASKFPNFPQNLLDAFSYATWGNDARCYVVIFLLRSVLFSIVLQNSWIPDIISQLGYIVGSLLVDTVAGWRYMYGVSVPLALVMGIGMWWLPPSPRWILLRAIQGKGNLNDLREIAISCLCRLRGRAIGDSAPQQVDEILSELSQLSEEKEARIGEVFQGKCLKALTIGAGLVLFQQVF